MTVGHDTRQTVLSARLSVEDTNTAIETHYFGRLKLILLDHVEEHTKRSWLENDCIDANAP